MTEPTVFITSLNERLFTSYGRRMIESWISFSSVDAVLVVCFEDENSSYLEELNFRNIIPLPIWSDEMRLFKDKYGQFTEARGIQFQSLDHQSGSAKFVYNYRYDALRFYFKIFALTKTVRAGLTGNRFAWLDADTVCTNPFSPHDLENLFPRENEIATYLGRQNFPQPVPYSECGFVGYNGANPLTFDFLEAFEKFYIDGNIFLLKEWHDCVVFDYLRAEFQKNGGIFRNLAAEFPDSDHPFMQSELAQYFDHLKGPERKIRGFS